MKNITIATIAIIFSSMTFASTVEETLAAESVKATVAPAVISAQIEAWHTDALANVDNEAHKISDRAPIEARRQMVRDDIQSEYNRLIKLYSL